MELRISDNNNMSLLYLQLILIYGNILLTGNVIDYTLLFLFAREC